MPKRTFHVTLLTRLPRPGETKTRLIPLLGADGAAALHTEMGTHVSRQLRMLRAVHRVRVIARVTGGSHRAARDWLKLPTSQQSDGDLGQRQLHALEQGIRRTHVAAVIGSDAPSVDAASMHAALEAAAKNGASFIAADDGGYCMLAVRFDCLPAVGSMLLSSIDWGTSDVLKQCLAHLGASGIVPMVLGPFPDVDRPEDMEAWSAVRAAWYEPPRSLAVIVPTLNEAEALPGLLEHLSGHGADIIIVDAGSTDDTREVAKSAGARVIESERGRGLQLNAGARTTDADALLFLHADTTPPGDFTEHVLGALSDPDLLVGAFRFDTGARTTAMRILEAGTRLRSTLLHLPYGDQGLFCRRVAWQALGGFPESPVMEDYEFVARARRAGRVRVLPQPALTSDRRWMESGPWRWTALNLATVARYRLGSTPEELAAWRAKTAIRSGRRTPCRK